MKKLLKFALSRTFLFAVLFLLQLGLFLFLTFQFTRLGTFAYLLLTVGSTLAITMAMERSGINPAYKIMWILITVALPASGPFFYLLWGKRTIVPKRAADFLQIERRAAAATAPDAEAGTTVLRRFPGLARMVDYLATHAAAPVYGGTACRYFAMGEDFFPVFLQRLEAAQQFIFLEYFIIKPGAMWDAILAVLQRKAAEGVDVRLIYDGFGSLFSLPGGYDEQLREMGIQCRVFSPLALSWHLADYKMLNHRDHRKVAVIDGQVGFTGGLNFADEYINQVQRFGVWKDTAAMLEGPGVYPLTVLFLKMWDFVAGCETDYRNYRPAPACPEGDGFVQPYSESPLDDENVAENAYFCLIQSARRYVYLTTPYLILDNEMVTALCLAAKSGVDVRIITPGIPDKWYVYLVTQSFYPQLLAAGVRIYEYTPGFLHAKMYVCDDEAAIVGSANMDYRSLYLHFENCVAFYGGHMVRDVKADFAATMAQSREVTLEDTRCTPFYKWLGQVFLRFFAPLM